MDEAQSSFISETVMSWTVGAAYCAASKQDCAGCGNYPIVGSACRMPEVVKALQERRMPIPISIQTKADGLIQRIERALPADLMTLAAREQVCAG